MRVKLEGDSRVRAAALIAHTFSLDPVAVLEERRPLAVLLRLAAHNVYVREENKRHS